MVLPQQLAASSLQFVASDGKRGAELDGGNSWS